MSGISTHVLDTSRGQPARGVRVSLERRSDSGDWTKAGAGITDGNGRVTELLAENQQLEPATYRLIFRTGDYFEARECFYPEVAIEFSVRDPAAHYHVPLLLSPYGYTTYRGS